MARQYQPRKFFRQTPNYLLEQYFKNKDVLDGVNFKDLTETKIEPIYKAWLELPEKTKAAIEGDFREIDFMATEGGTIAIIDEAIWHGEKLGPVLSGMKGDSERALWTFLNRPRYWNQAVQFCQADNIPQSRWRKRKNIPRKPAGVEPNDIEQLEKAISKYFHFKQGRGKNCRVECYRRKDLDYFFAYPEDYAQASIEWINNDFKRRPHHPAFEVIFVYSQSAGTLDIFFRGPIKPVVPELQKIFGEMILKVIFGQDEKDNRVYDLNPLMTKDFQFNFDRTDGVEDVLVKKLRLSYKYRKNEKIILEADPTNNRDAVYDLLEKVQGRDMRIDNYNITQVGLKALFYPEPGKTRGKTRTFDVSFPNSCSLKQDGRDLIIRKMLVSSGIEPQEPIHQNNADQS